jgi:hypothetical protein
MLSIRPITRDEAHAFIRLNHRHHGAPVGELWRHALQDDNGVLVGVATVGRPIAHELDDELTMEVTRLCTDTHPNACSMLYAVSRRTAIEKGYRRGLTYILASESGATLEGAGWEKLWMVAGRSWNCESRPRTDKHPTEDKVAYGWGAWSPELIKERNKRYEAAVRRREAARTDITSTPTEAP